MKTRKQSTIGLDVSGSNLNINAYSFVMRQQSSPHTYSPGVPHHSSPYLALTDNKTISSGDFYPKPGHPPSHHYSLYNNAHLQSHDPMTSQSHHPIMSGDLLSSTNQMAGNRGPGFVGSVSSGQGGHYGQLSGENGPGVRGFGYQENYLPSPHPSFPSQNDLIPAVQEFPSIVNL